MICKNKNCNKKFEPRVHHQIYCSRNCKEVEHKRKSALAGIRKYQEERAKIILVCPVCNKKYNPKSKRQVCCSIPCMKEYRHSFVKRNNRSSAVGYRKWLSDYKKTLACIDCGVSGKEHPYILDFHHCRGIKNFTLSSAVAISKFKHHKDIIQKEIDKCDVVCSNCHRIRHAKDKTVNRYS